MEKNYLLKLKKIGEEWKNLIYKNLEFSDKYEILNNMKDLAITSFKTNKDENISFDEDKIFKTKKR